MVGEGAELAPLALLSGIGDRLVSTDTSVWPDVALANAFVEVRREIDRLEACAGVLLRAVEGRGVPCAEGASSTVAWVQWRTGQRWRPAKASLDAAVACEGLVLTAKAWAQGEISASAAQSICRGVKAGHEAVYAELEATLVGFAGNKNFRELDNLIGYYRKCCDALDDVEPEDRNGVHLSRVGERWALDGDLDALGGECLDRAIKAAVDMHVDEDDPRTAARRRADAIVEIARFFLDHEDLPLEGGEAPRVTLTITWEELRSWLPIKALPSDPADLAALLSTSQKRRLLCDCHLAWIILGPDGQPLDVGREERLCNRWMRRALAHRDRGCRYPGCDRTSNRCQAHHVIPWETGGVTALHNLVLLCPYHHHVVHRQGWTNHFDGITYTVRNQHGRRIE